MRIENIAIEDIALASPGWDDFIFTYPLETGALLESIRAVELQQPIVVAEIEPVEIEPVEIEPVEIEPVEIEPVEIEPVEIEPVEIEPVEIEQKYKIVIGVRRLLAGKELGWKKIPALVHRNETREKLLWLSLQEKVGGRPLNAMEKSRVLQRFAILWHGDVERLQKEICPLIDIPPTIEAVETFLFFKEFSEKHQEDLAGGKLTPQHAELLRPLRPEDRRVAADKLFGEHRVSLQEAREMVDNVSSLAARDGVRVKDIFERPQVKELFVNENATPRQRAGQLRTYLQHERFPRLSETEEKFAKLAEPLAQHKINVRPPRFFEGNELTVTVRAGEAGEIGAAIAAMQDATKRGLWKKLFALLEGE